MKRIPLTQGKFAIVDNEDYEWLMRHKWYVLKNKRISYAVRQQPCSIDGRKTRRKIWMHREIIQVPQERQVDHRNHDGLDNRRANLRECTQAENLRNQRSTQGSTSRYRGVCWEKEKGKWRARIWHNDKLIHIGRYVSEESAAIAYNTKAKELFGEFAYVNIFKE